MTEDTPSPYTGPIRVVWIDDTVWMRAGDRGTIKNTIAALGAVAQTIAVPSPDSCRLFDIDEAVAEEARKTFWSPVDAWKSIFRIARIWRWKRSVAAMLRPLKDRQNAKAPVVFVSTGQLCLRPAFRALRGVLNVPNLWLDVRADISGTRINYPDVPDGNILNATLPDFLDHCKSLVTETGLHSWVTIPYLPERRDLPSKAEARERLGKAYGLTFERPLVAALIGEHGNCATEAASAASVLGADLVATTSRRTQLTQDVRAAWHENTRIFYEFGKSEQPNPYTDLIAAADYILADGDSFSLPSDVLALGKPVALFGGMDKARLIEHGFATVFKGTATEWHAPPAHETPGVILNRTVRTELAKLVGGGP